MDKYYNDTCDTQVHNFQLSSFKGRCMQHVLGHKTANFDHKISTYRCHTMAGSTVDSPLFPYKTAHSALPHPQHHDRYQFLL